MMNFRHVLYSVFFFFLHLLSPSASGQEVQSIFSATARVHGVAIVTGDSIFDVTISNWTGAFDMENNTTYDLMDLQEGDWFFQNCAAYIIDTIFTTPVFGSVHTLRVHRTYLSAGRPINTAQYAAIFRLTPNSSLIQIGRLQRNPGQIGITDVDKECLQNWLINQIDAATPPGILNKLWVSPNGDNATAEKGNPFKPWQDLRAALSGGGNTNATLDIGSYSIVATSGAFPSIPIRRVLKSDSVFITAPGYSAINTQINVDAGAFTDAVSGSTSTNIKFGVNAPYADFNFINSGGFAYGMYMVGKTSSVDLKFNRLVNTDGSGAGLAFSRGRAEISEIRSKQIAVQIRHSVDSVGVVRTHRNKAYAKIGKMVFENLPTGINGMIRFSINSSDSMGYYRVDVDEIQYTSGTNDASMVTIEASTGNTPYGAHFELNVGKSVVTPTGSTQRGFWKSNHPSYLKNCTIIVNIDNIEDNHFFESIGEDVYYDNCKIYFNIKRGRFSGLMYDITDTRLENGTELYFHCDDCVIGGDAFQVQSGAQGFTVDATSKWEVSGNYRMTGAHQLWDFLGVTSGSGRIVFKNVVAVNDGTVPIISAPGAVNVDIINVATNTLIVDTDVTERIMPIVRDANVK